MSLELVPLGTMDVTLARPVDVSDTFLIGEVTGARLEGDRIRASMLGHTAADWLTKSPQGHGELDVRLALQTDDGAVVYTTYGGRLHFDTGTVYAAPTFHTGDERYTWLNRIQAVSKGHFPEPGKLIYEIFELR